LTEVSRRRTNKTGIEQNIYNLVKRNVFPFKLSKLLV
jgi:hypothetical protein